MTTKKFDVYQNITEKMIASLEQGVIPWRKPWTGMSPAYNIITGKHYSLLNCLCLSQSTAYATFAQWSSLGGKIKKGRKSEMVCYWQMLKKTNKDEDGKVTETAIPFLKHYAVFPLDDIEWPKGISEKVQEILDKHNQEVHYEHDRNALIEKVLSEYREREGITLSEESGDKACFSPSLDDITVPEMSQFEKSEEYYSTLAHEHTHSTGVKKRLDRDMSGKFGSKSYAREELVAEMGAAFLLSMFGIESDDSFDNNTAYIQAWLEALKNDNRLVVTAAGKAQKAVEYILNGKTAEQIDQEME